MVSLSTAYNAVQLNFIELILNCVTPPPSPKPVPTLSVNARGYDSGTDQNWS